ncbi:hypothetical protein TSAR_014619 [Trichomalopsis sarcophagae]|uniref:Uncharacterized protein n=1 Tax=Trichomalopsis sarcophagae TaxID=543379 RepID=A0A232EGZ2_9HYME|nr:hypothetical protein TSAR_014619 [Trichomalopsis sarcophagae]
MKRKDQSKYEIRKFNPNAIDDDSEYVYFGIEKQLKRIVNPDLYQDKALKLQFHFDGLPLYSSSSKEFWPVLGKVYTNNNLYQPFAIAVHCGKVDKSTCDTEDLKINFDRFSSDSDTDSDHFDDSDESEFSNGADDVTIDCEASGSHKLDIADVNPDLHQDKALKLQFHSDGLSLYSSSSNEFWPVLGKVYTNNNLYQPFAIAVHCGKGKPKCVKLYLKEFTEELNKLLNIGIDIDGKHYTVSVMCMICDRPARAFVKCIKGHTGYYACERCTVNGCRLNNKTVFSLDEGELRSYTSFRNQEKIDHHHDISPLESINPSMDMNFSTIDESIQTSTNRISENYKICS